MPKRGFAFLVMIKTKLNLPMELQKTRFTSLNNAHEAEQLRDATTATLERVIVLIEALDALEIDAIDETLEQHGIIV